MNLEKTIKRVKMGLIGLTLSSFILGCEGGYNMKNTTIYDGLHMCKPGEGFEGPIYFYHGSDERNKVLIGTNNSIEFFDVYRRKMVKIFQDSNFKYECSPVRNPNL